MKRDCSFDLLCENKQGKRVRFNLIPDEKSSSTMNNKTEFQDDEMSDDVLVEIVQPQCFSPIQKSILKRKDGKDVWQSTLEFTHRSDGRNEIDVDTDSCEGAAEQMKNKVATHSGISKDPDNASNNSCIEIFEANSKYSEIKIPSLLQASSTKTSPDHGPSMSHVSFTPYRYSKARQKLKMKAKQSVEESFTMIFHVVKDPECKSRWEAEIVEYNHENEAFARGDIDDWVLVDFTNEDVTAFENLLQDLKDEAQYEAMNVDEWSLVNCTENEGKVFKEVLNQLD